MTIRVVIEHAEADADRNIRARVQGIGSVYAAAWTEVPPGESAEFHVHQGVQLEVQEGDVAQRQAVEKILVEAEVSSTATINAPGATRKPATGKKAGKKAAESETETP